MAKPNNPVLTMQWIIAIMLLALIVVVVFIKQTQKDGKIGYFFKDDEPLAGTTTSSTKMIASPASPANK